MPNTQEPTPQSEPASLTEQPKSSSKLETALEQALGIPLVSGDSKTQAQRRGLDIALCLEEMGRLKPAIPAKRFQAIAAELDTAHDTEMAFLLRSMPATKETAAAAAHWTKAHPDIRLFHLLSLSVQLGAYWTPKDLDFLSSADGLATLFQAAPKRKGQVLFQICRILLHTSWGESTIRAYIPTATALCMTAESLLSIKPGDIYGLGRYMDGEQIGRLLFRDSDMTARNVMFLGEILGSTPDLGIPKRTHDRYLKRILQVWLPTMEIKERASLLAQHGEIIAQILGTEAVRTLIEQTVAEATIPPADPASDILLAVASLIGSDNVRSILVSQEVTLAEIDVTRALVENCPEVAAEGFAALRGSDNLREVAIPEESLFLLTDSENGMVRQAVALGVGQMKVMSQEEITSLEKASMDGQLQSLEPSLPDRSRSQAH